MFTLPKIISPFYSDIKRIPRKLKKKIKAYMLCHYSSCTNEQRLWNYLEKTNNEYKQYLISNV